MPHVDPRVSRAPRSRRAAIRRRRLLAVAALALVVIVVVAVIVVASSSGSSGPDRSTTDATAGEVTLMAGRRQALSQPVSRYWRDGRLDEAALRRLVERAVPNKAVEAAGGTTIAYRYDVEATLRRVRDAGEDGGTVQAVRRPVASSIEAPVLQQAQRNTCESAALEILLSTVGKRVDQARLQNAFPTSGQPDPVDTADGRVWGDPERGYVGRPDGGGVAGGFGIFPPPVKATAERFGVELEDISGSRPQAVYDRLLQGRAVMVWIGLSDGPYGEWRSPEGRRVRVNFGEHTVVLHGLRTDGSLEVSNPLYATSETWTKEQFEGMWELLDRRALAA